MPLEVDQYTDCSKGQRDRTLFRTSPSGDSLLILADGSEIAFSQGFQPLVDLLKEVFYKEFLAKISSIDTLISEVTGSIYSEMKRKFPESGVPGEAWHSMEFVALIIKNQCAFPVWIGSPQAKLFRNGRCIQTTDPHITPIPTKGSEFIVTNRTLSTQIKEDECRVDTTGPWALAPGDVLALADYRLFSLDRSNHIEGLVCDPISPAKKVVEWAQAQRYSFAESALIARIY
jgi:hypothetical protein